MGTLLYNAADYLYRGANLVRQKKPKELRQQQSTFCGSFVLASIVVVATSMPSLAYGENIFVKTYSKEELNQKIPSNPNTTFADKFAKNAVDIFSLITQNQNDTNQKLKDINQRISKKPGYSEFDKDLRHTEEERLHETKQHLASESQKAATEVLLQKNPIFSRIKNGLTVDLALGEVEHSPKSDKKVRYGLVLIDIIPKSKGADLSSISDMHDEMGYAGKSEAIWTIGPVNEKNDITKVSEVYDDHSQNHWLGKLSPTSNFKGKIEQTNPGNLLEETKKGLPELRIVLTQEQNLYQLTCETDHHLGKKALFHELKLPLYHSFALSKKFDEHGIPIQTSALNILAEVHKPILNLHHLDQEHKIKGEIEQKLDRQSFKLSSESPAGQSQSYLKIPRHNINLEYVRSF